MMGAGQEVAVAGAHGRGRWPQVTVEGAGVVGAAVLFGAKSLPTEQRGRQPTDRT